MRPSDEPDSSTRMAFLLASAALLAMVIAAYRPSLSNGFLNYDDPQYLTANRHVQEGLTLPGVGWAFTSFDAANWHPLTWLSHMLDVSLFGLEPRGHHAVSIGLHAVNALLVFVLLWALTKALWPAWLGAALWAVHPLRAESVAWAAERKDVLSALFGLLAALAYIHWARSGDGVNHRRARLMYWASVLAMALSLMAKPMLVTLPLLLLALDWTVPGRTSESWRRILAEKIPFAALAAASCLVTLQAQRAGGAMETIEPLPLVVRLETALIAPAMYLWKTLWPHELSILYPHPRAWATGLVAAAALVLAAISLGAWLIRRRAAGVWGGWCWFLISLLPVIGLVQVGRQWIADRYTYVPAIGLSLIVAALCARVRGLTLARYAAIAILLVLTLASAMATSRHVEVFRDSKTIFTHALAVHERNALAHHNLGEVLLRENNVAEARRHFQRAVDIEPEYASGRTSLGAVVMMEGDNAGALVHLREAVRLKPNSAQARGALGMCLQLQGRLGEAREQLEEAVRLNPLQPRANFLLAQVLLDMGHSAEAKAAAERELEILPGDPETMRLLQLIADRQVP